MLETQNEVVPVKKNKPGSNPKPINYNQELYTTGQVARICGVAPRTVSGWFDSGLLKGYRIPGSQDRRIPREDLMVFLEVHGMHHALASFIKEAGGIRMTYSDTEGLWHAEVLVGGEWCQVSGEPNKEDMESVIETLRTWKALT